MPHAAATATGALVAGDGNGATITGAERGEAAPVAGAAVSRGGGTSVRCA